MPECCLPNCLSAACHAYLPVHTASCCPLPHYIQPSRFTRASYDLCQRHQLRNRSHPCYVPAVPPRHVRFTFSLSQCTPTSQPRYTSCLAVSAHRHSREPHVSLSSLCSALPPALGFVFFLDCFLLAVEFSVMLWVLLSPTHRFFFTFPHFQPCLHHPERKGILASGHDAFDGYFPLLQWIVPCASSILRQTLDQHHNAESVRHPSYVAHTHVECVYAKQRKPWMQHARMQ
eukprot:scaffold62849_cov42-Attheya_sp.AAC.2